MTQRRLSTQTRVYKVLKWFSENPGYHTREEISKAFHITPLQAGSVLRELRDKNQLDHDLGRGKFKWSGDTRLLEGARQAISLAPEILEFLETQTDLLTTAQIAKAVNYPHSTVQGLMKQLVISDAVTRTKLEKKGPMSYGYRIKNKSATILPQQKYVDKDPPAQVKETPTGKIYHLINARHWSHDTVGCVVPLAKGYSGLEKL